MLVEVQDMCKSSGVPLEWAFVFFFLYLCHIGGDVVHYLHVRLPVIVGVGSYLGRGMHVQYGCSKAMCRCQAFPAIKHPGVYLSA